ncbi:MAG: hypothetical protein PHI37_05630 [Candidatus Gracilibacteria bacterium]|nr:hypothetical protein [Candidatus Gracilibacteria bacterium]
MKKIDSYLKRIILILLFMFLLVFASLLGTFSFSNHYALPMIIIPFWGVILGLLYLLYKYFNKNLFLYIFIIIIFLLNISIIKGILYEYKVDKLHIGMDRTQVENLYGTGTSGLGFGSSGLGSADCFKCQGSSYQFSYRLNGNLWYSHLEDSYHVCYINDIVCDFDRIGL